MTSFLFRVFLFNRKIHICRLVFGHLSLLLIFFVTSWCKFHFCVDLTNCCSTTNYWDGLLKEVGLENKKSASLTRSILTSFTLCTADCVYKGKKHVCSGTKTKKCWREKTKLQKKHLFNPAFVTAPHQFSALLCGKMWPFLSLCFVKSFRVVVFWGVARLDGVCAFSKESSEGGCCLW